MDKRGFEKIWNLYRTLYPGHHNLDDENLKIVWEVALMPFSLDDVAASVMAYARKKKYFPNIAEITENLEPEELPEEAREGPNRPYGDTAWMAPYIRKMAAKITEQDAEKIHAAGLMTWGEATANGIDFAAWNRKYRERFPVRILEG